MAFSFIDFYIGYPGHPRFKNLELIEDDIVRVIIQKYEMVIFTNKGELLGDPNFGATLVKGLVWLGFEETGPFSIKRRAWVIIVVLA